MKSSASAVGLSLTLALSSVAAAQPSTSPAQIQKWQQECKQKVTQNQHQQALAPCQQVVTALEQTQPDYLDFAVALNMLAEVYFYQGPLKQVEPLLLRSLRIREKVLGPDHIEVARSLNGLAALYQTQGELKQAEPLFLRSLQIREKSLGPDHPDVGSSLNALASLYKAQGELRRAEPLYRRSLQILEKALGPDHIDVARTLNNLANLYQSLGANQQAEPLFLRSLHIFEKTLGAEHPLVAQGLNNLAILYSSQGMYQQAEPLFLRSLQIREKKLGPDHREVAQGLNNLASLYKEQGAYQKAEPLFLRSLQIREKALGSDHPEVAESLENLANIYKEQGAYEKAKSFYQRSLTIKEKALGPDHPTVAVGLLNLASLYMRQGAYAQAVPLLTNSVRIWERALGPEHPRVAMGIGHLARIDVASNQLSAALPRFARGFDIGERALRQATTEARVTDWLDDMRGEEDIIYSLLLRPDASLDVRRLALRASLLRKGRAAEAGLVSGWAIRQSLTRPEQVTRFDRWQSLRGQHETIFLRGPDKLALPTQQQQMADLRNQIDDAEQELARAAPQTATWKLPEPNHIIEAVAAKLSVNSVFVEVLQVNPFRFGAKGAEKEAGEPRYVALLLFPGSRIEWVNLGDAALIDRAAGEFLLGLRNPTKEPLIEAQALYKLIFAPLMPKLGNVKSLVLSPDGSLNLIPFAALHDGRQYLLDSVYQIQYVTSGRDLLRHEFATDRQPALVLADPDFSGQSPPAAAGPMRSLDDNTQSLYQSLSALPSLPGARLEGLAVATRLHVTPFLGAAATEPLLRAARAPSVLHIATHGLFLEDSAGAPAKSRSALLLASATQTRQADKLDQITGKGGDRSLSRAALVLAGAAHAEQAPDAKADGLLTAEEARSLNLYGTQLVVLSACDTGRGTVKAGQGVYGLRRAFFAAGAEAVVMSLWPVSDTGTQGLMQRYYQLLLDPKSPRPRIAALSEAMRAVKMDHPHPYYWAPFIANGLDIPLRR